MTNLFTESEIKSEVEEVADKQLTPLEARFVHEFLLDDSHQGRAAIRAGYSVKTAGQSASALLKKPHIKKRIEEARRSGLESMGVSEQRVLQELALLAFANPQDYIVQDEDGNDTINLKSLSKDRAASLLTEYSVITAAGKKGKKSSQIKVKSVDKIGALTLLMKYLGMTKEKVEVSGSVSLEQLVASSMTDETSENVT